MHRVDGRIARLERFIAAWALALALLFLGGIVSAETQRDPRIIRTSRIEAPANADPRIFLPPPTAFDAAQAREQLDLGLGQALEAARRSVPLAPWNRWGLARVAIDLDMARLDPERSEYYVDLPDGRRAWLTLDAELHDRMRTFLAR